MPKPKLQKVKSPYIETIKVLPKSSERLFSFDDLMEVWYFANVQGATLWQYSIEKERRLPEEFMRGLDGIKKHIVDASTLSYILSMTPIVMGLYDEVLSVDPQYVKGVKHSLPPTIDESVKKPLTDIL